MFTSSELRRIARDKLSGHWGIALLVSLIGLILGGGGANVDGSLIFKVSEIDLYTLRGSVNLLLPTMLAILAPVTLFSALLSIGMFIIGACVDLGRRSYFLDLCLDRPEAGVGSLFSRFNILFKALGLRLYMALFIFLWSLLFLIPGIVAAYRYAMAPYLMAQHPEMGIGEAVNRSKELMMGHKGRLFGLHLSFIGWAFLCCLSAGIGFLWLNPYVAAADAAFYLERSGQGIPMRE